MDQKQLQQLYLGTWAIPDKDRKLFEIAKYYHDTCEAYDRLVCTGPVRRGSILPRTNEEFVLINRHAAQVKEFCHKQGAENGLLKREINKAIGEYHGKTGNRR